MHHVTRLRASRRMRIETAGGGARRGRLPVPGRPLPSPRRGGRKRGGRKRAAMAAAAGPAAPRTKTKKKQKRFVPQRVKVPRAADPLLAVLAWGVNHQVRPGTNGAGPRPTGAHRSPPGPGLPQDPPSPRLLIPQPKPGD